MARILETRELTPVTKLLVVESPLVAASAQPGQFVIGRVGETGERVPISITDSDAEAGTVTIVVQEVGRTSGLICALDAGDQILDFAGPLGRPAPLPETGRIVLVGGGFGAGAVYPLARELKARGVWVEVIAGARTAELVILRELLGPACDAYHICTDDGSAGYHGFVTDLLAALLDAGAQFTHCFAVGPMAMMRAVADTTRPYALQTFVSLDPIMVDGTGMCGACRVTVAGRTRFACVDGPFFDGHDVDFDEAVTRSRMYADEEHRAAELAGAGR
jgi:ferredoxin--NADP+ reductase